MFILTENKKKMDPMEVTLITCDAGRVMSAVFAVCGNNRCPKAVNKVVKACNGQPTCEIIPPEAPPVKETVILEWRCISAPPGKKHG